MKGILQGRTLWMQNRDTQCKNNPEVSIFLLLQLLSLLHWHLFLAHDMFPIESSSVCLPPNCTWLLHTCSSHRDKQPEHQTQLKGEEMRREKQDTKEDDDRWWYWVTKLNQVLFVNVLFVTKQWWPRKSVDVERNGSLWTHFREKLMFVEMFFNHDHLYSLNSF